LVKRKKILHRWEFGLQHGPIDHLVAKDFAANFDVDLVFLLRSMTELMVDHRDCIGL
jgi:hypothetical protein